MVEVDAASSARRIDEMREWLETVRYAPVACRYRVTIMDEAHQIQDQAASALLKTLEEPPPHLVVILCTTHPWDILGTIRSRLQHYVLRKPGHPAPGEGARPGGPRRGHRDLRGRARHPGPRGRRVATATRSGLLDQIATYAGGRVEAADALELLGAVARETIFELVDLMAGGDAAGAFELLRGHARRPGRPRAGDARPGDPPALRLPAAAGRPRRATSGRFSPEEIARLQAQANQLLRRPGGARARPAGRRPGAHPPRRRRPAAAAGAGRRPPEPPRARPVDAPRSPRASRPWRPAGRRPPRPRPPRPPPPAPRGAGPRRRPRAAARADDPDAPKPVGRRRPAPDAAPRPEPEDGPRPRPRAARHEPTPGRPRALRPRLWTQVLDILEREAPPTRGVPRRVAPDARRRGVARGDGHQPRCGRTCSARHEHRERVRNAVDDGVGPQPGRGLRGRATRAPRGGGPGAAARRATTRRSCEEFKTMFRAVEEDGERDRAGRTAMAARDEPPEDAQADAEDAGGHGPRAGRAPAGVGHGARPAAARSRPA